MHVDMHAHTESVTDMYVFFAALKFATKIAYLFNIYYRICILAIMEVITVKKKPSF
jgi:hypothetical protein